MTRKTIKPFILLFLLLSGIVGLLLFVPPKNIFLILWLNLMIALFLFLLTKTRFKLKFAILVGLFFFMVATLKVIGLLEWMNLALATALFISLGILIK